jgi:hypothetical protein
MFARRARLVLLLVLVWTMANILGVFASWGRSYFAPIDPIPQTLRVDTRKDLSVPGRVVTIIATKPTPSKGDFIGHMWIAWPQTPPKAPAGTKEAGFYARDQLQAIRAMAVALLAPWGVGTGQVPVPGFLKVDDGWWRHVEVEVTVDEAAYQAALAVDSRWRAETRYSLRPGIVAFGGAARTWACQDYVLDVANALGLQTSHRNWTQFPMGSFLDFAKENGLVVKG